MNVLTYINRNYWPYKFGGYKYIYSNQISKFMETISVDEKSKSIDLKFIKNLYIDYIDSICSYNLEKYEKVLNKDYLLKLQKENNVNLIKLHESNISNISRFYEEIETKNLGKLKLIADKKAYDKKFNNDSILFMPAEISLTLQNLNYRNFLLRNYFPFGNKFKVIYIKFVSNLILDFEESDNLINNAYLIKKTYNKDLKYIENYEIHNMTILVENFEDLGGNYYLIDLK